MPKPIKKRISKRPTLDTEAEVKEKFSSLKDTIRERKKTAVTYGSVFVIAILTVVGFLLYSYNTRQRATELEHEAYKIYYSASPQGVNKMERVTKALDLFKKAYDTSKTPISLFYIADCYYELGRYDEAIKTLEGFTGRYSSDEHLAPLAYQKMAMAYIVKGDMNGALKTLDALYNLKSDMYKDFSLIESAKLLEKAGKTDEAKKKYDELVKKFPNSPFVEEAKAKLQEKKEG
jgi:predicted negative regulator of RcsB-dependent stress response